MIALSTLQERIVTGGNALLQACDAIAVKFPRERNGEAVPELLLKLFKHGLDGEDENALATLAPR